MKFPEWLKVVGGLCFFSIPVAGVWAIWSDDPVLPARIVATLIIVVWVLLGLNWVLDDIDKPGFK